VRHLVIRLILPEFEIFKLSRQPLPDCIYNFPFDPPLLFKPQSQAIWSSHQIGFAGGRRLMADG